MSTEIREPFLLESMRKKPTGDIRHNPGKGALGTSAAGFLAELDEYLAARDRRVRAEALREAAGDLKGPTTWAEGPKVAAAWLRNRADRIEADA